MTGVKFRPGSPSTLGEKVASGLVWRFGTFDCVSDNLACFKDGFGDSGSFLDIGSHRFYVTRPFPEEVTDVLDPLCDIGSDYSESSDLCAMVKVLALEEDGGGDLPHTMRPPLECPPLREQDFHLQSGTCWILPSRTYVLHSTSLSIQPSSPRIWSRRASPSTKKRLASKTLVGASSPRSTSTTPPKAKRWPGGTSSSTRPRAGRGAEPGGAFGELPPVITKPTYSTPTKNLRAALYITSELAGL
jgi:hypothetical protein